MDTSPTWCSFSFCYRPVDSDCPLKPLNSKLYRGLMGVFGLEAGGDGFLPHSPQKCVSSITLYSPHASSPTVMVGVRLLCKMRDLSLFFSAQHISKAAVERSHQSSWWKYEVPRRIWHISGGEADCWCWRVASAHRKKKKTHLALSLNAAHNIQFWSANRQWFFIMWESKKRRSTFYPLAPAVFNQCKRGSGVKHRFPHFLLAKKVKLNVQPYASLNDPANFSVCWSLACFQVLLMYSSSAQRASW